MAMGAEHANASFLAALRRRRLRRGDGMMGGGGGGGGGGWRDGRRGGAVLPVAVGHGVLSLLLLEELCDGQQLFQHVLRDKSKIPQSNQIQAAFRQYGDFFYQYIFCL